MAVEDVSRQPSHGATTRASSPETLVEAETLIGDEPLLDDGAGRRSRTATLGTRDEASPSSRWSSSPMRLLSSAISTTLNLRQDGGHQDRGDGEGGEDQHVSTVGSDEQDNHGRGSEPEDLGVGDDDARGNRRHQDRDNNHHRPAMQQARGENLTEFAARHAYVGHLISFGLMLVTGVVIVLG
ncbi:unnamed protein product [Amoebophrya sp. A25]|nr:unnamed protein product [Amoebophrya sp. A25]|eukprot:GSA25T00008214001.1